MILLPYRKSTDATASRCPEKAYLHSLGFKSVSSQAALNGTETEELWRGWMMGAYTDQDVVQMASNDDVRWLVREAMRQTPQLAKPDAMNRFDNKFEVCEDGECIISGTQDWIVVYNEG